MMYIYMEPDLRVPGHMQGLFVFFFASLGDLKRSCLILAL